jgi:hypothetical protein
MSFNFNTNRISKYLLTILLLTAGCTNIGEDPLTLNIGAEPSAKMRNDIGIEHFLAGRNFEALLQFNQANLADPTSGEIHFNLGRSNISNRRIIWPRETRKFYSHKL